MARNEQRRRSLADAGLSVLAREGARGLTHRAVDAEAGVPQGTTSNYFKRRDELLKALVERIEERLAPDQARMAELSEQEPSRELFASYIKDIVRRLIVEPDVTLALFTLRLEAVRRPEVAEVLGGWLRSGFAADVEFNRAAGLPGEDREIALFHYAIDGLVFDRLTLSVDAKTPTDEVVESLVAGLIARLP